VTRDALGGMASIVIGGAYLLLAYRLQPSALDDTLGAGGVPRIYGWTMLSLGVLLLFQHVRRSLHSNRQGDNPMLAPSTSEGYARMLSRAVGLLLMGVAAIIALETFGYLLTITVLLASVVRYLGAPFNARLISVSILGALILWLVFTQVLQVSMPQGFFTMFGS